MSVESTVESLDRTLDSVDRRRLISVSRLIFWVLFGAGFIARVIWMYTDAVVVDADRGVVFLMAVGVSHGEFPLMYWGQAYGGTLLPIVSGLVMLVAGSHVEVLMIVSVAFFAGAALLVRAIAAEAAGRIAGDIAGIAFWFPGLALLFVSVADPGFYGPTLVCALAATLLALRGPAHKSMLQWLAVGVLAGLAVWQSPMGAALALPAVLIMFFRHRSWRHWLVGVVGALLGSAPWLAELLLVRSSVSQLGQRTEFFRTSLTSFFTELAAYAFGASQDTAARWSVALITLALLVLLGALTVARRSVWFGALIAGAVLSYFVVILGAGAVLHSDSYRYAVFVLPALAVSAAWLLSRIPLVGVVALFLFPALTLGQMVAKPGGVNFDTSGRYGIGMSALVAELNRRDIDAVYADYWLSYSLSAYTDGEIAADALTLSRYRPYQEAAEDADPMVIVVYENLENDRMLAASRSFPPSSRSTAGGYAIYTFEQPFDVAAVNWNLF